MCDAGTVAGRHPLRICSADPAPQAAEALRPNSVIGPIRDDGTARLRPPVQAQKKSPS